MVTHPTRGLHPVVFLGLMLTLLVAWGLTLAPPLAPGIDPLPAVIFERPVARVAAYYWAWAVGLAAGGVGAIVVLQRRRALSGAAFAPLLFAVVAFLVGARWQRRLETMPLLTALALDPRELFAPGMRISLGLLLGGLTACGGGRILGAPWRAVGDAYALAASVVIPIGRIGCVLAGCCMGAVCGRWPAALCIAWPPGSEPFREQVVAGSIPLGALMSLPVR